MKLARVVLYFFVCSASASEVLMDEQIKVNYESQKQQLSDLDLQSRELMSSLYDINMRMKGLNRKRSQLDNKMLSLDFKVRNLTRETQTLENLIQDQNKYLSKRLRAIYTLGEQSVPMIIFSTSDRHELDQNIKYLNLISKQDFKMVRDYENNLKKRNLKKEALKKEVTKLLQVKNDLRHFENKLTSDQESKAKLLSRLDDQKKQSLSQIQSIKEKAKERQLLEALNLSFYEHKGQLQAPADGEKKRGYGVIENERFGYKLSHKGITFETKPGAHIKAIHDGKVAHHGEIPGYGQTIIVDHGDHYFSVYTNLLESLVTKGLQISRAQIIAKASSTLYFEIRHFSETVDPEKWLK